MPFRCRCDCNDCESATQAPHHCHRWPCRYANLAIQRIGQQLDPAHASAVWHNSVKGCVECEWDRLGRFCRDNGIIQSSHGPKDFADKMIDYLKNVRGIA
jgi:hypothetical protein